MRPRETLLVSLLSIYFLFGCQSGVGKWQHFRISAYSQAEENSSLIFLHFHENENPLCEKQKTALEELIVDSKFSKVEAYRVIWGREPELQRKLMVTSPCTIVVQKGRKVTAVSNGDPEKESFSKLLEHDL